MLLQDHLEKYCNVFIVSGFDSASYDIHLKNSSLLSLLLGGAMSLDFSLKEYMISGTKGNFRYEWSDDPKKVQEHSTLSLRNILQQTAQQKTIEENIQTFEI